MTGGESRDERVTFRCTSGEKRAFKDAADERDVALSTLARETLHEVVNDERDVLDDDVVAAAERDRLDRRVDEDMAAAGIRTRTASFAREAHERGDMTTREVYYSVRKRWDMAEELPDFLRPKAVVEYLDAVIVLLHVYEETHSEHRESAEPCMDAAENPPLTLDAALNVLSNHYPDTHTEWTRSVVSVILDAVEDYDDVPDDLNLERAAECTRNGVLDDVDVLELDDAQDIDDEDIRDAIEPEYQGRYDV